MNNGKTGLFNPAHSVAYLGNILPSVKPQFSRGGTFYKFPVVKLCASATVPSELLLLNYHNIPSILSFLLVSDGKNAYSSKRRLRPDMISSPQGDLKHTGHVGLDGAYFGDVAFLGDKVFIFV